MADTQYSILVNDAGKITYPKNFIENNNIATWAGGIFSDSIKFGSFDYLEGEGSPLVPNDRSSYTEITNERIKIALYKYGSDESSSMLFGTRLSLGNGTIVLDGDNNSQYDANFTISHNNYTSDFNLFCGKKSTYEYGSEYGIGKFSMSNNGRGIEFADGVYNFAENSIIQDPLGMSLKFTNPALNVTQAPIYGFTSTDLSSNANKDKFVYTAKAVEDRLASISSSSVDLSNVTGSIILNPAEPTGYKDIITTINNDSYTITNNAGDSTTISYEGLRTSFGPSILGSYGGSGENGFIFNYDNYGNSSEIKLVANASNSSFAYSEISFESYVNGGAPDGFIFTNKVSNTDAHDPYGVSFKMLNPVEAHATQVPIYGFVHEHDGVIPEMLVYTVKGVENYVKNYTNNFIEYGTYDYDTRTETPTKLSPSGFIEAYDRGGAGDNTYIRVSGTDTYSSANGTYVDIANSYTQFCSDGPTSHITVHSVDGADVSICDNKLHLPVYNQDGTLAKKGNTQEYVAIKAVKDATTGIVSLVVMQ